MVAVLGNGNKVEFKSFNAAGILVSVRSDAGLDSAGLIDARPRHYETGDAVQPRPGAVPAAGTGRGNRPFHQAHDSTDDEDAN